MSAILWFWTTPAVASSPDLSLSEVESRCEVAGSRFPEGDRVRNAVVQSNLFVGPYAFRPQLKTEWQLRISDPNPTDPTGLDGKDVVYTLSEEQHGLASSLLCVVAPLCLADPLDKEERATCGFATIHFAGDEDSGSWRVSWSDVDNRRSRRVDVYFARSE